VNAIIALLDEAHSRQVEALWDELERDFGVRNIRYGVPWPHVTFHGAEGYRLGQVEETLRAIAGEQLPLTIRAEGLGIFAGPQPVLYVPVVRNDSLNRLHARLWEALAPLSEEISPYHVPEPWVAHITLAQWDIPAATLGAIVTRLAERPINWQFTLPALGLITGEGEGTESRYTLRGRWGT
jgi:2'-5' RNA ligase